MNVSATYSAVVFRLSNGVIVAMDRIEQRCPILGWLGRPTARLRALPLPADVEPVR